MDIIFLDLGRINGKVLVAIEYKNIKNIHLKVYNDLSIKVSVPERVSYDWIEIFLNKRKDWINKQIYMFKQSSGGNSNGLIKNGYSIQMLGKDYRIFIKKVLKNITVNDKNINITVENENDLLQITNYFDNWWNKTAKDLFQNKINEFYNLYFRKFNINKPVLQIRKMKTMWGNCNQQKSLITLNKYLLKADLLSIEYVVLHELTHLIYPKHNSDFYDFLTIHMPNWKERKMYLDTDIVQSI